MTSKNQGAHPSSVSTPDKTSPPISDELSESSEEEAVVQERKESSGYKKGDSSLSSLLVESTSLVVWPLMLTVPLLLSSPWSPTSYHSLFKEEWYKYDPNSGERPKPLGLSLGLFAVAVGQFFIVLFFCFFKHGAFTFHKEPLSIQTKGAEKYMLTEGILTHFAQPGGFFLLATYLSVTWMLNLMPASYYSFEGSIQWTVLAGCLIFQDGVQYAMHRLEHDASSAFYRMSHKPHHRFTNPRMFDAFNGSLLDTSCMIIIPLYITANVFRTCNVWTYMAFGSSYACWLTLIHSEYVFIWDGVFRKLGLGTPGDHHVHHKFFKYNFGHLFMWFDQLCGTYRDPQEFAPKIFHKDV